MTCINTGSTGWCQKDAQLYKFAFDGLQQCVDDTCRQQAQAHAVLLPRWHQQTAKFLELRHNLNKFVNPVCDAAAKDAAEWGVHGASVY